MADALTIETTASTGGSNIQVVFLRQSSRLVHPRRQLNFLLAEEWTPDSPHWALLMTGVILFRKTTAVPVKPHAHHFL